MSILLARQPTLVRPTYPAVNTGHWAARHLRFAYNGNATGRGVRGIAGVDRALMTQVGTEGVVISRDGFGISSATADQAFYTTARSSANYSGDITIMWRGVLLGAPGATNSGCLIGVRYGSASGAPFEVFSVNRSSTADNLIVNTNNGSGYIASDSNVGLSSLYNIPLTIIVSNAAGSNAVRCVISTGRSTAAVALNVLGSTSGAPRATTGTDRIQIGENLGAGRFPNAVCTAAAIWSRAFDERLLIDLARDHADVFTPRGMVMPLSTASFTAPEIVVTGNGNAITDGDGTASATNHTDFGTVTQGTPVSRTFTITNSGDADLVISSVALSGANAAEFTITTDPAGTIAPSGTATLVVRADADNLGTFSATVTINSNDANEAAFDFAIAAEVVEAAATDDDVGGGLLQPKLSGFMLHPYHLKIRKRR